MLAAPGWVVRSLVAGRGGGARDGHGARGGLEAPAVGGARGGGLAEGVPELGEDARGAEIGEGLAREVAGEVAGGAVAADVVGLEARLVEEGGVHRGDVAHGEVLEEVGRAAAAQQRCGQGVLAGRGEGAVLGLGDVGVDAVGEALEDRALLGAEQPQDVVGDEAHADAEVLLVGAQGGVAEEGGEAAGAVAPREVEEEEAVAGDDEAVRAGEVDAVAGVEVRDVAGGAEDVHLAGEPGDVPALGDRNRGERAGQAAVVGIGGGGAVGAQVAGGIERASVGAGVRGRGRRVGA
jgi:hypothetical protein